MFRFIAVQQSSDARSMFVVLSSLVLAVAHGRQLPVLEAHHHPRPHACAMIISGCCMTVSSCCCGCCDGGSTSAIFPGPPWLLQMAKFDPLPNEPEGREARRRPPASSSSSRWNSSFPWGRTAASLSLLHRRPRPCCIPTIELLQLHHLRVNDQELQLLVSYRVEFHDPQNHRQHRPPLLPFPCRPRVRHQLQQLASTHWLKLTSFPALPTSPCSLSPSSSLFCFISSSVSAGRARLAQPRSRVVLKLPRCDDAGMAGSSVWP